jgi:hypothetical protein
LPALVAAQPSTSVYIWFDATLAQAETVLADSRVRVQHGREFVAASAHGQHIILLEHYPLYVRKAAILEAAEPARIRVLSALNEPLLLAFGGENLMAMMEKMGLAPGETITPPLISKSIARAQQRLAEKVVADFNAQSSEDWFRQFAAKP